MPFPVLQVKQFDIDTDPEPDRDKTTGNGFVKFLNTSPGGELNFGNMNITTSGNISDTKVFLARCSDYGDASGLFNFRFFMSSTSHWNTGTYRFLYQTSSSFLTGHSLGESALDIPITIPSTANLFPNTGEGVLSGIADRDVTDYVYMAVLAREDVDTGGKGGAGTGGMRLRIVYDLS